MSFRLLFMELSFIIYGAFVYYLLFRIPLSFAAAASRGSAVYRADWKPAASTGTGAGGCMGQF
jgi:hypothetical protein